MPNEEPLQQRQSWKHLPKKLRHPFWGYVVSALSAYLATLAPDLIRGIVLVFAFGVAVFTFHKTELGSGKLIRTVPAGLLFAVIATLLYVGPHWWERHFASATPLQSSDNGSKPASTNQVISSTSAKQEQAKPEPTATPTLSSSPAQKEPKPKRKPTPKPPQQDNSVHIEKGATVDQTSKGPCSPNIIGGSPTVNCSPSDPNKQQITYDFDGWKRFTTPGVLGADDGETSTFEEMKKKYAGDDWNGLLALSEQGKIKAPEWATPYWMSGSAHMYLCQKEEAITDLQYFVQHAGDGETFKPYIAPAQRYLNSLNFGQLPEGCK